MTKKENDIFKDDDVLSEETETDEVADTEAATETDEPLFDEFEQPPVHHAAHHDHDRKKKRRARIKRNLILWGCIVLLLVGCAAGLVLYISSLRSDPGSAFETTPTPQLTPTATPAGTADATPEPTPTVDPYQAMWEQADKSLMKDIVNVLVIGVDYAEERVSADWNGKRAFHADVMLLLAIDFNNNTVNMISIPRDTYAKIPGVDGKYKINASIDCGGGWPTEGGFQKCCEAAEWMLGGYPVDYYVAVSMPIVKELVNAVGGVDYDVDIEFEISDRHYTTGMQHMDGQAVLDYIRVRKDESIVGSNETGDKNRVNRQKKILLALFNKMKNNNMILSIPAIIQAFSGRLYTNLSNEQFMALAVYAYDLPSSNIQMHSMGGTNYNIFNWNFCLTDQKKRVNLIKEIYGVKVPQYTEYSKEYALEEWGNMLWPVYDDVSWPARNAIIKAFEADYLVISATPTPSPTPSPTPDPAVIVTTPPPATVAPTPTPEPEPTQEPDPMAETTPTTGGTSFASNGGSVVRLAVDVTPTPTPMPVPTPYTPVPEIQYTGSFTAAQHKKYQEFLALYKQLSDPTVVAKERIDLCKKYKESVTALAKLVGFKDKIVWDVVLEYEIEVDFR